MINKKSINCDNIRTNFPYIQVAEAMQKVNELFASEAFYERIAAHEDFDLADVSPETIASLMRKARLDMSIDLYYAHNPLDNIDGYDDVKTPSVIHMNIWTISRPVASLCNSMVHATVHAVNAFYDRCYFGHDDIPGYNKENTAPYAIGAIAERMIAGDDKPCLMLEHDAFDTLIKATREPAILSFGTRATAR